MVVETDVSFVVVVSVGAEIPGVTGNWFAGVHAEIGRLRIGA